MIPSREAGLESRDDAPARVLAEQLDAVDVTLVLPALLVGDGVKRPDLVVEEDLGELVGDDDGLCISERYKQSEKKAHPRVAI